MRISTKMLASLLLVTAVMAAAPGIGVKQQRRRQGTQFDRILQRHDRKGELRAEVLGIDAPTFRQLHKTLPFIEIVRRSGFVSERAFRLALLGKLKGELRQRGWTTQRIDRYVIARSSRLG